MAQAVTLEKRLELRVERARLEARGVLKSPAEHMSRKIGLGQTSRVLEHHLKHGQDHIRVKGRGARSESPEYHRDEKERRKEVSLKLEEDLKNRKTQDEVAMDFEGYNEKYDWKARSERLFGPKRDLTAYDEVGNIDPNSLVFEHRRSEDEIEKDKAYIIAAGVAPADGWGAEVLGDGFKAMARDMFEASEDACVRLGRPFVSDRPVPFLIDGDEVLSNLEHSLYAAEVKKDGSLARAGRMQLHERAIDAAEAQHEVTLQAKAYSSCGALKQHAGDFENAEWYLKQGLEIAELTEDRLTMGRTYASLGDCYRSMGLYSEAKAAAEKALEFAIELEDHVGLSRAYGSLGCIFTTWGEDEISLGCFHESLVIARNYDLHSEEARAVANLASLAMRVGTNPEPMEELQRLALKNYTILVEEDQMRCDKNAKAIRNGSHRLRQGRVYGNLGQAMEAMVETKPDKANQAGYMYEAAKHIAEEEGDTLGAARASLLLGSWNAKREKVIQAAHHFEFGIGIADAAHDIPGQILGHVRSAQMLRSYERYGEALAAFAKAHSVALSVNDLETEAWLSYEMGQVFESMCDVAHDVKVMTGKDQMQMHRSAHAQVWMIYTIKEFTEAVQRTRVGSTEEEMALIQKCITWIDGHIPGATKLD